MGDYFSTQTILRPRPNVSQICSWRHSDNFNAYVASFPRGPTVKATPQILSFYTYAWRVAWCGSSFGSLYCFSLSGEDDAAATCWNWGSRCCFPRADCPACWRCCERFGGWCLRFIRLSLADTGLIALCSYFDYAVPLIWTRWRPRTDFIGRTVHTSKIDSFCAQSADYWCCYWQPQVAGFCWRGRNGQDRGTSHLKWDRNWHSPQHLDPQGRCRGNSKSESLAFYP